MKIIVHIGMSKTGTTALQIALFNARRSLLDSGILYPDGGYGHENHLYLCPLFMEMPDLPRRMVRKFRGDPAAARRSAEVMWGEIRREVEAVKPRALVLSSEYFLKNPTTCDYGAFRRRLGELSDDIDIVLYVREPASRFAARIQQGAKHERPILSIDGTQLQRELPLFEQGFRAKVDVRLFERAALVDQDIVSDFVARSVAPVVGPLAVPTSEANESISAEAAVLLIDVDHGPRIAGLRESLGFPRFRELVRHADDTLTGKKAARLRPEIADDVRRASLDTVWLRDRYGLIFQEMDYSRVDGAVPGYDTALLRAVDLLNVDPDRLSAMKTIVGSKTSWNFGARVLGHRVMSLVGLASGRRT